MTDYSGKCATCIHFIPREKGGKAAHVKNFLLGCLNFHTL